MAFSHDGFISDTVPIRQGLLSLPSQTGPRNTRLRRFRQIKACL